MECPHCKSKLELIKTESNEIIKCSNCSYEITDPRRVQDYKDAQMIEEDMVFWRAAQKYR